MPLADILGVGFYTVVVLVTGVVLWIKFGPKVLGWFKK